MSRWVLAVFIGVFVGIGLLMAEMTGDYRLLPVCIPLSLFAVLRWWWLGRLLDETKRRHRLR